MFPAHVCFVCCGGSSWVCVTVVCGCVRVCMLVCFFFVAVGVRLFVFWSGSDRAGVCVCWCAYLLLLVFVCLFFGAEVIVQEYVYV